MKTTIKTIIATLIFFALSSLPAIADEKEAKKPTGFNTGIYRSVSGKVNIYVDRINRSDPAIILLTDDSGSVLYREIIQSKHQKFGRALNIDQLEDGHYNLKLIIGKEVLSKSIFLSEQKVERSLKIE